MDLLKEHYRELLEKWNPLKNVRFVYASPAGDGGEAAAAKIYLIVECVVHIKYDCCNHVCPPMPCEYCCV